MTLRFVIRDGEKVLQQLEHRSFCDDCGAEDYEVWVDVPIEEEQ